MKRRVMLGAAGALALIRPLRAQTGGFPSRGVSMVVAFPPGGQADVVARPVAAALERHWKQPVPVVNRAGASGEIGNASVARAAPDGYTLLMALSSLAILPEAARLFGRQPAYELDQLAPIALFTADPTLLVVPAAAPWRTLEEFIADAKARPGAISYSSSGNYSALHVPMAMLTGAAGIDLLHVPFQGGAPALTALLGNQVQALATGPGPAAAHIREGRLRALACWGARRLAEFPEVPTLIEKGFPEAEFYIWAGVFAPAATPAPLREALRQAMAAVAADAEVRRALAASGNTLDYRDGDAFEQFFRTDSARLQRAVRRIGKVE
ncbi:tripartite tricarboxylate transporter substrate binding protein [Siccirubricoccus sp. G192]|uniref:Bug family tripartite tricarboxylate transporter substrate binding protein n=1 Tax=Siccirubricoccus sp. G192 TaxID=2849651 RepID=UPI001C2CB340|nr:tripartite tricarboxylate transporter substrate binding protein [Siccirubricoccus sp. G192]MBV1797748.1 tripartite tricarboxylate transporter substrate binding protein [Siccirubricoccus sp. G192]